MGVDLSPPTISVNHSAHFSNIFSVPPGGGGGGGG